MMVTGFASLASAVSFLSTSIANNFGGAAAAGRRMDHSGFSAWLAS
jgi:hypothetical protein